MSVHIPTDARPQETLGEANLGRTAYPRESSIQQLFEEQAGQNPDAIALLSEEGSVTYSQLNERANRLAHHLRKLGATPGALVGLSVDRSPEMLVAILAILKAGCAYVPFDPNYPEDRLAFMAEDTNTPLIVSQTSLAGVLGQRARQAKIVRIDGDAAAIALGSGENPPSRARAEDIAYVMYTSGSTGRPKGVLVPHRAVVRLVRNTNYCSFSPDEVFLQLAPISFDASTFEIWGALLNGARLAIMPPQIPSLEHIGRAVGRYGVTTMWLTAGLFNLMVEQRLEDLKPLRQLLAGGDVLSPAHVRKALSALAACRLINGYGPTESTTFACCHTIRESDGERNSIPIGKPISNTQVYILDSDQRPAPAGGRGELFIGGDGLAAGYLNNPDLTAQKFVPNPFAHGGDSRLYRTGDYVRDLGDGTIEFLGRADDQVKLHGYRIELGEIEAALGQHPAVSQAVVAVQGEASNDKRLAGYVTLTEGGTADSGELREFLRHRIPHYMVPAAIEVLHSFPLSPNGKIDRASLPQCALQQESAKPAAGAQDQLEQTVLTAWRAVLRSESVGTDDNFFDIGGDSLQIIEVHSELQKTLGSELSLTDLFEYPTISSLVKHLRETGAATNLFQDVRDRARKQREALARQRQQTVGTR